jgi:hypothetical protein
MLHRLEWEKVHGSIPEGYTVDHKCKNRQCQNVNHMQLLLVSEYARKDNALRYLVDNVKTLRWIAENSGMSPKDVAERLQVRRSYVECLSRRYPEVRKYLNMKQKV